jgi:U2 small nuclear ribonucleoprotein B''
LCVQQIQYAKTKSDAIAKLDGTFHKPAAAAGAVTATELQQSIFNAPPSALSGSTTAQATLKPPGASEDQAMEDARSPTVSLAGQKRRRDDEEEADEDGDSEGDAAMEEDSDDD